MSIKCVCCEGDVKNLGEIPPALSFAGKRLNKPMDGGALFLCVVCGLAFRFPQPDKNLLDELYRNGCSDNWQNEQTQRADWDYASHWIRKNSANDSELLDVGCFDGGFLAGLKGKCKLNGLEIHEAAAKKAISRGVCLLGGDFSDIEKLGKQFDVVSAFDVIEHTHNPLAFLTMLEHATKNGGAIIVSTGNVDAHSWKLLGAKYWYCTIGEHLVFISPRWCRWAAEKLGLEIVFVSRFSHLSASPIKRGMDALKNITFFIFPALFAKLRKYGMGGEEFRAHKEMLHSPPSWMTAKDHFLCIFVKK